MNCLGGDWSTGSGVEALHFTGVGQVTCCAADDLLFTIIMSFPSGLQTTVSVGAYV